MVKTIFVTRLIPDIGLKMLRDKGYTVDVRMKDSMPTTRELIRALKNKPYDAVVTLLTDPVNAVIFDAVPSAKIFANYASGYDNIDVVEAKKRAITITNAPAVSTSEAVAEHTIALMLALAARIVEADESVRRGKYKGWSPMNFIGTDILGKTLGLIGAGRIGEKVAHYASGLGLKIIYTDIVRNERIEKECGSTYFATPEEVLRQADIVSLHTPLLPTTRHLINEERLKMMKKTAFIVNTSRGAIIDETALAVALREGVIAGAGLDVFEFEPKLVPGLVKLQNVILTPHIASASDTARNEMSQLVAESIIDFFEGRVPKNMVNP
jgi:glyoxylate reductase